MITETLTIEYYMLPDGTYALIRQEMDYGDIVLILLVTALFFMKVYELWTQARSTR